jgi:hypothetical protein
MFKTLLEEYQAVQNQSKQEVKEVQFNKPFPDSKLYEHSSVELSELLYEERRKSYLIPKGSVQEAQYHSFVSEAVAILEFAQTAGHTFSSSIQKSKEAHDKGDSVAAKAHFKNAKKSRYNMNEKDLDQATPHFKAYKELQKHYDDKPGVAESSEINELSKGTLGSYAKKASASAAGLATTAMHHKATEKQWRDKGEDEKADTFSKYSFDAKDKQIKRQAGIIKAVDRLTKESAELDEGTKILTFSGQDSNKNPYHVHVGKDTKGDKYHVISGRPGVTHTPTAIFGGSNSEAEGKMNMVSRMVVQGKHDEALKRLNSMSHIKFQKNMEESQELDELSTELLGRYKKAASVSATAADARKDFKTGNKRFSGIMKATNKQFDNDMKKLKKESADIELDGDQ